MPHTCHYSDNCYLYIMCCIKTVQEAVYDWRMVRTCLRDVWRYVLVTNGKLCAIVSGMKTRQLWSVDNWEDSIKAHQVIAIM